MHNGRARVRPHAVRLLSSKLAWEPQHWLLPNPRHPLCSWPRPPPLSSSSSPFSLRPPQGQELRTWWAGLGLWGGPRVLGTARGWGSRLVIINMVSSSVCPALHVVPRGKGWPPANIRRRCASPPPSPVGSPLPGGRAHCSVPGWLGGLWISILGGLPRLPGCLLLTPSGSWL